MRPPRLLLAVVVIAASCDGAAPGANGRGVLALVDADGAPLCRDFDDDAVDDCAFAFADTLLGDTRTVVVTLENRGDAALTLPTYAWSGSDGAFALGDVLPRALSPGAAAPLELVFTPAREGSNTALLSFDDGDTDPEADLVVNVVGAGVPCGAFAEIDVVAIDGSPDRNLERFFAGDVVDVVADLGCVDAAALTGVEWSVESLGALSLVTPSAERATVTLGGDAIVRFNGFDADNARTVRGERRFDVRPAPSFTLFGNGIHVARDSLTWCGPDDCFAGSCDVAWGIRGGVPDANENFVGVSRARDGRYTAAVVADAKGQLLLRAFVDGALASEVLRFAPPGEPHIMLQLEVRGGVVDVVEADDTAPQVGACFQ